MLSVPAAGQDLESSADPETPAVKYHDFGSVDLAVKDTELSQVLEMLAIQSRKNIITSKNVSGTVSANLFDVTFEEALDAILEANGYGYMVDGSFIYIYTAQEIAEIEKQRKRTEARTFRLSYLGASDANDFITPLLSEVGRSSYRGDVAAGFEPDISDGGADSYAFTPQLVVTDYAENLDAIAALIAELDQKPKQVLVEATVLQTKLNEANAFGVDFSVIADMDFTDLTDPLAPVFNLLQGDDSENGFQPTDNKAGGVASTVGNTSGPGGFKVGIVSNDVSIFLRILDEVTDTVVLAKPKLMALNRQRAQVLVGARVGYLSTTSTETTTTQTVSFLDTGIKLVFRPFISDDGSIRMEVAPSVSEASLRTVTDANGLLVTIPDELTNEVTTNVRVQDGQTLILGGLFRESTRISRRQIPWVGDIPILGYAFRGQDDAVDRDEIIFLLTPTIAQDDVLWSMGKDSLSYIENARVGARLGLLCFSQEAMTAHDNKKAWDAYQAGDMNKALHYTNNSLRHHGQQPEMIRLREKIEASIERPHERSIIQRIFRKHLGGEGGSTEMPLMQVGQPDSLSDASGSDSWGSDPFSTGSSGEGEWPSDTGTVSAGDQSEGGDSMNSFGQWDESDDFSGSSSSGNSPKPQGDSTYSNAEDQDYSPNVSAWGSEQSSSALIPFRYGFWRIPYAAPSAKSKASSTLTSVPTDSSEKK